MFVVCVSGVRDRGSRRCVGVRPVPLIIPRLPWVSAQSALAFRASDRIDALIQMRVFTLCMYKMTKLIAVRVSINAVLSPPLITFNVYMGPRVRVYYSREHKKGRRERWRPF